MEQLVYIMQQKVPLTPSNAFKGGINILYFDIKIKYIK